MDRDSQCSWSCACKVSGMCQITHRQSRQQPMGPTPFRCPVTSRQPQWWIYWFFLWCIKPPLGPLALLKMRENNLKSVNLPLPTPWRNPRSATGQQSQNNNDGAAKFRLPWVSPLRLIWHLVEFQISNFKLLHMLTLQSILEMKSWKYRPFCL